MNWYLFFYRITVKLNINKKYKYSLKKPEKEIKGHTASIVHVLVIVL